jgi:spermidine dehydrogenase
VRGKVTRRDFLNGGALVVAAGLAPADWVRSASIGPADYPPAAGGFRGSAQGTFDVAHALRDGQRFDIAGVVAGERYDLVVVGAGISGLAAAWYYRREKPNARILLLDAHDDFGGHAQRNEFEVDGRRLIGYGGSEAMQSPQDLYSEEAMGLCRALGIEIGRFETAFDRSLYPGLGLSRGVLFKREHFGVDKLVTGDPQHVAADDVPKNRLNAKSLAEFIGEFPVSETSKRQLLELHESRRDPLRGKTQAQKEAILDATSYRDWLTQYWGLSAEAANTLQKAPQDFFAVSIPSLPASWALEYGMPGFAGLDLPIGEEAAAELNEPYIYHFPDGNASIARLLVRSLVPGVAPGRGMDDIVLAPFDYSHLDTPASPVRLRLRSTAVHVRNIGGGADAAVETFYVRDGKVSSARSRHVVLANYNTMIPYMVPELAARQREALAAGVRAPLVYINVALRNWRPWIERGIHEVSNPMGFSARIKLDYPVSLGGYSCPRSPGEPIVVHMTYVPDAGTPGLDQRAGWRAARALLYSMPFDAFEREVRDELTRILAGSAFDASRDIAAITVNRWAHGYSYAFNPLFDEEPADGRPLNEVGRARIGNIAIANSDAAWTAYAHAAMDEACRAVGELL